MALPLLASVYDVYVLLLQGCISLAVVLSLLVSVDRVLNVSKFAYTKARARLTGRRPQEAWYFKPLPEQDSHHPKVRKRGGVSWPAARGEQPYQRRQPPQIWCAREARLAAARASLPHPREVTAPPAAMLHAGPQISELLDHVCVPHATMTSALRSSLGCPAGGSAAADVQRARGVPGHH